MMEDWRNWLLSQVRLQLFWVFMGYLVVDRAARVVYVLRHAVGTELTVDLTLAVIPAVFLFYCFRYRDLIGSTILLCFVSLDIVAEVLILGLYLYAPGISAFFDPSLRIDRFFELAEILIGISFIYFFYRHWKPLFDFRQKLRSLSDDGLITFYVDTARQGYRAWVERKESLQQDLFGLLNQIYKEIRRRDQSMHKLYLLLNEPDDWVRVTAARQLLRKNDPRALNTLDEISQKKSEWSGWAGRMATEWREGKLQSWDRGWHDSKWATIATVVITVVVVSTAIHYLEKNFSSSTEQGLYVYAGQQPVSSLAPMNAARVPFTNLTFVNNSNESVTVSGITVQASSLPDNEGIAAVELVDETGLQIGTVQKLDSQNRATVGGTFTIPANSTRTYTIAANIASCEHACADNAQNISIAATGILSSRNLSGELPVIGAQHVINSDLKIGSVLGKKISTNIKPSSLDGSLTFAKFQFTADQQEDLMLYSIRFKYVGTTNVSDLQNVKINVKGTEYPVVWSADWTYVTATFLGGIPLSKGQALNMSISGNSSGNSAEFIIDDPSEVYFVGQTYGYGIQPVGI